MVEIGSYQGESTSLFAMYFKPKELFAIDPFVNGYDPRDDSSFANFDDVSYNFKLRIEPFPCIKHIKEFSYNVIDQFEDDSLDFVYIDGEHTYEGVLKDIKAYLPKIKLNGYIGGHDLGRGEVTKALIESFGDVDIHFEDSSWLIKITPRIKRLAGLFVLPNTRLGQGQSRPYTTCDDDIEYLRKNDNVDRFNAIFGFLDYLKDKNIKIILEVNCYQGETTELLAKYLNPTVLYVVDKFDKLPSYIQGVFDMQKVESNFNFRTKSFPCVKLMKFHPEAVLSELFEDGSIDMVYINEHDNKKYIRTLIMAALPKLRKDGFVAGIGWGSGDVVNACLESIGEPNIYFKDSSWITQLDRK